MIRESAAKRCLDLVLALVGLAVSAPFWILLPLAIKLEDGGPVFFTQRRVGKDGRSFRSFKFRSMVPGADRGREPRQASAEDPRITRVGRLLRATAMDELPQLLNILRGEMSFVGPRALAPREVEAGSGGRPVELREVPGYRVRHRIRPGLTGLAQVRAARDVTARQKFRYDLLYVRRRSLWLDVKLIARSVWISLSGAWGRVGREPGRSGREVG